MASFPSVNGNICCNILHSRLAFGFFNNRSILNNLNKSDYYNDVYKEMNARQIEVMQSIGLPSSVLEETVSLEKVYIAGKKYAQTTLTGGTAKVETDQLEIQLKENITGYLKGEKITWSNNVDQGIQEIVTAVVKDYKDGIQLTFLGDIMAYRTNYLSLIAVLLPILFAIIAILCYFLIRMHKYLHQGIRYIAYAMISSSILVVTAALYMMYGKQYDMVTVEPYYYQQFIRDYVKWGIKVFLYIGGIGITISLILVSLISYLKNWIKMS